MQLRTICEKYHYFLVILLGPEKSDIASSKLKDILSIKQPFETREN